MIQVVDSHLIIEVVVKGFGGGRYVLAGVFGWLLWLEGCAGGFWGVISWGPGILCVWLVVPIAGFLGGWVVGLRIRGYFGVGAWGTGAAWETGGWQAGGHHTFDLVGRRGFCQ